MTKQKAKERAAKTKAKKATASPSVPSHIAPLALVTAFGQQWLMNFSSDTNTPHGVQFVLRSELKTPLALIFTGEQFAEHAKVLVPGDKITLDSHVLTFDGQGLADELGLYVVHRQFEKVA